MKKLLALMIALCFVLSGCAKEAVVDGTYFASDKENDITVMLNNGYCLINVLSQKDGGTASVAVGGKYTIEKETVVVEIENGELKGEKYEFLYSEAQKTLTNVADGVAYNSITPKNAIPDGEYAYKDGLDNYVLTMDGDYCILDASSKKKTGEIAEASKSGIVSITGNLIEVSLDGEQYKFMYAPDAKVLMDTTDGRMYTRTDELEEKEE